MSSTLTAQMSRITDSEHYASQKNQEISKKSGTASSLIRLKHKSLPRNVIRQD